MTDENRFEKLLAFLPSASELHEEAQQLASEGVREAEMLVEALPSFDIFTSNDGGGQEGNIVFYKEDNVVIAALLYAYDHESGLAPLLDSTDVEESFVFKGIPPVFQTALTNPSSPLLWKYENYPATFEHVFATAATWTVDEKWLHADDLAEAVDYRQAESVDLNEMVSHIRYSFKPFRFVARFKEQDK